MREYSCEIHLKYFESNVLHLVRTVVNCYSRFTQCSGGGLALLEVSNIQEKGVTYYLNSPLLVSNELMRVSVDKPTRSRPVCAGPNHRLLADTISNQVQRTQRPSSRVRVIPQVCVVLSPSRIHHPYRALLVFLRFILTCSCILL